MPGSRGGPPGDLYVEMNVRPHHIFKREGNDLHATIPIKFSQAILGGKVEVPSLAGRINLKIPPGTPDGKRFRIPNNGFPIIRTNNKGNLIIKVHVSVPKTVNAEQRRVVEELSRLGL